MKNRIAPVLCASLFAFTLLGATAADAGIRIGINVGHHPHRHRVCEFRHHHRVCFWR